MLDLPISPNAFQLEKIIREGKKRRGYNTLPLIQIKKSDQFKIDHSSKTSSYKLSIISPNKAESDRTPNFSVILDSFSLCVG